MRLRQFVGRTRELQELTGLLDTVVAEPGTVVITAIAGTAGIGKTALALHWAHQVKDRFPDGQLHVNLRGFDPGAPVDPAQALHGFLVAHGIDPERIPGDLDARAALYRATIADRRMLIMLDNAGSAGHVRPLLPNTPSCLVIVTSRNRLDGLVVREGAHRIAVDILPARDAEELLANRVTRARLDAEPRATAELINLCARLPLALSLVGARLANQPRLPLNQLIRQLRDERNRLDTLDLGESDLDIRAVFSWSYHALSNQAARLFRLLGVHPGPDIDVHGCTALLGSESRAILTELTRSHLLDEYQPGRFRFHDLLRVYAAERAEHDEPQRELQTALHRAITYYLDTALLADYRVQPFRGGEVRSAPPHPGTPNIATYADALDWFMAENATLLSMITTATRYGFDSEAGQVAWACGSFLGRTGQRHERAAVYQTALDAARRRGDPVAQYRYLRELARANARLGQFDEAFGNLDEARALGERVDEHDEAMIQLSFARVFELQNKHADAYRHARHAWDLAPDTANPARRAQILTILSRQHARLGRAAEALPLCEQSLAIYLRVNNHDGAADAYRTLGLIHQGLGHHLQAVDCYQRSLAINRQIGAKYWEGFVLDLLGDAYGALGRREQAEDAWRQSLSVLETQTHPEAEPVRAKLIAATMSSWPQ